jgi:hypothetical protein
VYSLDVQVGVGPVGELRGEENGAEVLLSGVSVEGLGKAGDAFNEGCTRLL